MNTIEIFYTNTDNTIGSVFLSKITSVKCYQTLTYESGTILELKNPLLKTLIRELSGLEKVSVEVSLGSNGNEKFILITDKAFDKTLEYKRIISNVYDPPISKLYSLSLFVSILKTLKTKSTLITISKNGMMLIDDIQNTFVLAHKEMI